MSDRQWWSQLDIVAQYSAYCQLQARVEALEAELRLIRNYLREVGIESVCDAYLEGKYGTEREG